MNNLILSELYKLRRSTSFKISFTILFLLSILVVKLFYTGGYPDFTGYEAFMDSIGEPLVSMIIYSIFIGNFISKDFKNRTTVLSISIGHSRIDILTSKIIVTLLSISILSLIIPFNVLIGCTIINGFAFDPITLSMIFKLISMLLVYLIVTIACSCIFILISYLLRSSVSIAVNSVMFYVIYQYFSSYLYSNNSVVDILKHTTFFYISFLGKVELTYSYLTITLHSLLTILITLVASYLLFIKKEIK